VAISAHPVELKTGRVSWHVDDGRHNVRVAWHASIGAEVTERLAAPHRNAVVGTSRGGGLVDDNRYGCRGCVATLLTLLILEGAAL
jgi:hypothetical protein